MKLTKIEEPRIGQIVKCKKTGKLLTVRRIDDFTQEVDFLEDYEGNNYYYYSLGKYTNFYNIVGFTGITHAFDEKGKSIKIKRKGTKVDDVVFIEDKENMIFSQCVVIKIIKDSYILFDTKYSNIFSICKKDIETSKVKLKKIGILGVNYEIKNEKLFHKIQ